MDQPESLRRELGEQGLEVLDREAHVMDARPALRQELRDRRVLRGGLEQLDAALADGQEGDAHLLSGNRLPRRAGLLDPEGAIDQIGRASCRERVLKVVGEWAVERKRGG